MPLWKARGDTDDEYDDIHRKTLAIPLRNGRSRDHSGWVVVTLTMHGPVKTYLMIPASR